MMKNFCENRKPLTTCDALHDFVSFVQFKKCEKHPWRSVNFSKVARFSLINRVPNMSLFLIYRKHSIYLQCNPPLH